jgi:hypothetical protein
MTQILTAYSGQLQETQASIEDVIAVKKALAGVLEEETMFMDKMQIDKVAALQERKLKLVGLLERYMRYLQKHTELLSDLSEEKKKELMALSEMFSQTMKKNYDTLLVARAVNKTIVTCVTQTMAAKDNNPIYNYKGSASVNSNQHKPISITLNQTV